jgi:DNA-binding SARP family transcriptional activator
LHLFGQMQASDGSGSVLPRARKTRAILAILALAAPRPVLRTRLIGLLWSRRGKEQAHASLRQCVRELLVVLGPSAGHLLEITRTQLRMLDAVVSVDVRRVLAATANMPQTLDLFRPTLLEDLAGVDPAFDQWRGDEHDRILHRARSVAESALAAEANPGEIIDAAERLLRVDPAHEGAWRALIQARLTRGDRAAASIAFGRYTRSLQRAGMAPSPDVQAMLRGAAGGSQTIVVPSLAMSATTHAGRDTGGVRIAVLPFTALEGTGAAALSLGLAEEMTTALLRFRWISCVEPMLRAEEADAAAWQQLQLDYLLSGSIRHTSDRIRVTVKLLDMSVGGKIVWARHFDRRLRDTLTLQHDIACAAAAQIDPELLLRAAERKGSDPTSYDLVAQAIPPIYRLEPRGFRAAGDTLAAAVAADRTNAAAYAWWAYWHLLLVGQGWSDAPLAAIRRAGDLADRAVTLDPGDARALTLVGHVRGFLHKRPGQGLVLHERALSLNPSLALAWCLSGLSSSYLGQHDLAIRQIEQARQLSPNDPHGFFFDMALMMPHFLTGNYEEVAAIGRRAIELNPGCSSTYKGYLATLGLLGHQEEAYLVRSRLLALEPGFSVRSALERSPIIRREDLALYAEGLRRGGLREA